MLYCLRPAMPNRPFVFLKRKTVARTVIIIIYLLLCRKFPFPLLSCRSCSVYTFIEISYFLLQLVMMAYGWIINQYGLTPAIISYFM